MWAVISVSVTTCLVDKTRRAQRQSAAQTVRRRGLVAYRLAYLHWPLGYSAAMGTALVVVLLIFGVFVGVPLWLARLSATGRFYRLDRALGRALSAESRQPSRWAWLWSAGGAAAGYTTFGVGELVRGYRTLGVMNLIFAALCGLLFSIGLWMWRRRRSPIEAEDGPAAGRSAEAGR